MDGSHARHCEKIIVRCCQVRQCGGRPKPWKNKGPGSSVWRALACLRSPEPLRIYMRRSRVNCSEFLRWVQSRGRCCLILHNKHTASTHSSLFQRTASQKWQRIWSGYKSKSQNKPIIVCFIVKQLRGESCFNRNIWRIFKKETHGSSMTAHANIGFIYSASSWCFLSKPRWWLPEENMKLSHIPPITREFGKRLVLNQFLRKCSCVLS